MLCGQILFMIEFVIECIVIGLRQKTPEGASSEGVLATLGRIQKFINISVETREFFRIQEYHFRL